MVGQTCRQKAGLPLVILDGDCEWHGGDAVVCYWSTFEVPDGCYSIPMLVDRDGEALIDEYLAFVHELSQQDIRGQSLMERLRIRPDFSFWWMTLIAEKDSQKCPRIFDVFRVRALELLYSRKKCHGAVLCSCDRLLHLSLSVWCGKMGQPYRWEKSIEIRKTRGLRDLYHRSPHPVQAIIFLCSFLIRCWPFLLRKPHISPSERDGITIASYTSNMDMKEAEKGCFRSGYWNGLHKVLESSGKDIYWLLLFIPNEQYTTLNQAMAYREGFVPNSRRQHYFFLEEFFSLNMLWKIIRDYILLVWKSCFLTDKRIAFHLPDSNIPLHALMKWDWNSSLRGKFAMEGLIYLALFESAAEKIPVKQSLVYLMENQPWERALVYASKKQGYGNIIGCQHSSMRFFDLRYFYDRRIYSFQDNVARQPFPDIMAVNGSAATQLLQKKGVPEGRIKQVEALRYLYFRGLKGQERRKTDGKTLLVLTDCLSKVSVFQIKLLAQAMKSELFHHQRVLVKPHPNCPVKAMIADIASDCDLEIVDTSLEELLPEADRVFASNTTTAAVESAFLGMPTAVSLDPEDFNLSPLRGYAGIEFVATPDDLLDWIQENKKPELPDGYYCLDCKLSRWRHLLEV